MIESELLVVLERTVEDVKDIDERWATTHWFTGFEVQTVGVATQEARELNINLYNGTVTKLPTDERTVVQTRKDHKSTSVPPMNKFRTQMSMQIATMCEKFLKMFYKSFRVMDASIISPLSPLSSQIRRSYRLQVLYPLK